MSEFIHNELNPWYDWASTLGPCQQNGTATVLFGDNEFAYVGKVDDQGRACAYGTAENDLLGGTKLQYPTTFYANKVHGLANVDYTGINQHSIYERREAIAHGKITVYETDGSVRNYYYDDGKEIARKVVTAETAWYNEDATIGTALDPSWVVHI